MNFTATTEKLEGITTDLLAIGLFDEDKKLEKNIAALDKALDGQISRLLKKEFTGKTGETLVLYPASLGIARRLMLLGLGSRRDYSLESLRAAVSRLAPQIKSFKAANICFALPGAAPKRASLEQASQALAEALVLSTYQFLEYKTNSESRPLPLGDVIIALGQAKDKKTVLKGAQNGELIARAACFARDLGNHPSNVATPTHLAQHALELSRGNKNIKAKALSRAEIEKQKMGAFLSVAKGSDEEPKFIILEYHAKKSAPTVVLAGKGITFDSGGISIKPSDRMEEMKFDMAGAAAVMGTIRAAAELKLPVNLVGLIPATENLPSGKATKPGDVVRSRSGKTVEVVNTDAEGRLVLSDALDFAKKYKPDLVIDFATLTGAIVVSLGEDLIGAFSNTEKNLKPLAEAAKITGEKVWPMPLERSYRELLKSDVADLRNIGQSRYGDSINAALFLEEFTDYPWIHLDIAAVAWATREKPYRPKGATGAGVRLAIEFLKNFKKRS